MNAWWQFIQMLATAKKLSMITGVPIMACAEAINAVIIAYEQQAKWTNLGDDC